MKEIEKTFPAGVCHGMLVGDMEKRGRREARGFKGRGIAGRSRRANMVKGKSWG